MALTGQLSDMSLAELIEFFCNQRKTGRLKIDYQRGHSVFFIKDGELVDAKVGVLSGEDAVYFSLTLPNAAFDFSPEVLPTRRTINQSWTQVVLEGLRRLDEGLSPSEADAFGAWTPSEADVTQMFQQVDRLGAVGSGKGEAAAKEEGQSSASSEVPLSMMVDGVSDGGGKKKWLVMGVAASLVLVCAVAAIPLSGRMGSKSAASASPSSAGASQPASAPPPSPVADDAANAAPAPESNEAAPADAGAAESAAAEEARREARAREARERRERKAEERAKKEDAAAPLDAKPAAPAPTAAPSGPKSVRVTVNYDEAGRVTQASVAGSTPGAEAYGGTAVRIARGRRFPAGKAGSTVVTIPVN